jgi:hypothetical protein
MFDAGGVDRCEKVDQGCISGSSAILINLKFSLSQP